MALSDTEECAADLEAEADENPDERGEILLEAVSAWRRVGRPDRAREIAGRLVADGGSDGCFARVERTELSLDAGDRTSAFAELAELAEQPHLDQHHCLFAAELLVESGELEDGLAWFDRAVARLPEQELTELASTDIGWSPAAMLIGQRRELRERLGLPEDATDALAAAADPGRLFGEGGPFDQPPFPRRPAPRARMLVFQRAERAEARRRWPDVYDADDDGHYSAVELNLRDLRESGMTSLRIVPATAEDVADFAERTGDDPTDSTVKERFSQSVPDSATVAWPPERNAPCWCGSARKYKKCCGRPDPRPG